MGRTILLSLLVACFSVTSAQLLGGAEDIDDLTDPAVMAAANAAVQYLNRQNPPDSRELILIRIISGTQQVPYYKILYENLLMCAYRLLDTIQLYMVYVNVSKKGVVTITC